MALGPGGMGVWLWGGGLRGGGLGLHGVRSDCGGAAGGADRRLLPPPAGRHLEVIPSHHSSTEP